MSPTIADLSKLKKGDYFTVLANQKSYTEGKVAAGRIFQLRELAYPYVFANYNVEQDKWINSPWRLILDQGIELIKLTENAVIPSKFKKKVIKKK